MLECTNPCTTLLVPAVQGAPSIVNTGGHVGATDLLSGAAGECFEVSSMFAASTTSSVLNPPSSPAICHVLGFKQSADRAMHGVLPAAEFHNPSPSEHEKFKPWLTVYSSMLQCVTCK